MRETFSQCFHHGDYDYGEAQTCLSHVAWWMEQILLPKPSGQALRVIRSNRFWFPWLGDDHHIAEFCIGLLGDKTTVIWQSVDRSDLRCSRTLFRYLTAISWFHVRGRVISTKKAVSEIIQSDIDTTSLLLLSLYRRRRLQSTNTSLTI